MTIMHDASAWLSHEMRMEVTGFTSLRAMHTVGSLRKSAGGPTRTVTSLCQGLGRLGVEVDLISQTWFDSAGDSDLIPPPDFVRTIMVPAHRLPGVGEAWAPGYKALLNQRCGRPGAQLIHDHGLWLPTNHAAARVAHRQGIPLIVSPRGMLEPWAVNHRVWKKRLAWFSYQRRDLQPARVLHATAPKEAVNLRRLGLTQPIAVIPNGIDLPAGVEPRRWTGGRRVALFLSRIHPVKGLLNLVDAWAMARPAGWRVLIAGPDEDGHRAVVEKKIRGAGLTAEFDFVGPVDGVRKAELYRTAHLFILPSFTENFGVAVAEALSHGLPVITTRGTPWADLESFSSGWWVETGPESLAEALRAATNLSDDERVAMGERGRTYVRRYNWDAIAKETLSLYRWVLGQGERPACVRVD